MNSRWGWGAVCVTLALSYLGSVLALGLPDLSNDSGAYLKYARTRIDSGIHGHEIQNGPDMHRELGYPFFIASVLRPFEWIVGREDVFALKWITFCQGLFFLTALACLVFLPGSSQRYRRVFAAVLFLSPTLWGAHTVIYSESLAATLVIFAFVAAFRSVETQSLGACLAFGLLIGLQGLVRYSQVYWVFFCGFVGGFASIYFRVRGQSALASKLFLSGILAILCVASWNLRNRLVLGPEAYSIREPIVLAGKILRVESIDLFNHLPQALVCAVGTNLCQRIYGEAASFPFEIRESDRLGIKAWKDHVESYTGSATARFRDFRKQYFRRYLDHPFLQFVGSLVEMVRIGFCESVPPFGTRGLSFTFFPRIWHFAGSLLVWALFWSGLSTLSRAERSVRLVMVLSLAWITYHFALMSQVTNLVRYVIPLLPCIYAVGALFVLRLANTATDRWSKSSRSVSQVARQ